MTMVGLGCTSDVSIEGQRGNVAIYCGPAWQRFSPDDIELRGLGGSETAAIRLGEHLAQDFDYAVSVYADVVEGCYQNVLYRDWRKFEAAERHDLVISSRTPEVADWGLNARVRMLWAHDLDFGTRLTAERAEGFDYVLCLSEWHRQHLADTHPFCADKLRQIRNGIQLAYFEGPELERAPRVLYTSAPDRGLDVLLELWPQIRAKVPGAELAYAYWEVYERIAAERPEMSAVFERVKELSTQDGVTALGSLSQPDLAKLMRQSLVWTHPSFSTAYNGPLHETSCIGAMEAQAAGCVVVASSWGALWETVEVGSLVGGEPGSERWREAFAGEVVDALINPDIQTCAQREGPAAARGFGWGGVAREVASLSNGEWTNQGISPDDGPATRGRRQQTTPGAIGRLGARAGQPTICLNMIVRNEADVVRDTLDSVASHIDSLVVVDTGSTDATIETIRDWAAERKLSVEIHERPWRDFGHNRSEALELAQGRADYIWVIDADDLLVGELDLSGLRADSYLLRYEEGVRFWRKQIFRGGLRWRYEGVVHEYPVCDGPATEERLTGDYHIAARRVGARNRRPDKYQRDAALLREAVESDQDDARAVFYLAQSCFDAGDYTQAHRWYVRRTEMGGFAEEVYYSFMRCAAALLLQDEPWERALGAYLAAYQARPVRAEPLYEIARHYRLMDQFELGYLFANLAAEKDEPDELLFVDPDVYDWKAFDELAVCAYHTGRYEESFAVCSDILRIEDLPEADRLRIVGNRDASLPKLDLGRTEARNQGSRPLHLAALVPGLALSELRIEVDPDWPCTGASIALAKDGLTALVRTSVTSRGATWGPLNYVVEFDEQLGVRSVEPLVDPASARGGSRVFDELRLIVDDKGTCASGLEYPPNGKARAVLLRLRGSQIVEVAPVTGDGAGSPHAPFVHAGKPYLIAAWSPTRVLDPTDGRLVSDRAAPPLAAGLTAGSNGVEVERGWLFVATSSESHHRFVLLDGSHWLAALSPPFSIAGGRQECCWGVANRGQELVMAFGFEDRSAGLAFLTVDDALALLEPC